MGGGRVCVENPAPGMGMRGVGVMGKKITRTLQCKKTGAQRKPKGTERQTPQMEDLPAGNMLQTSVTMRPSAGIVPLHSNSHPMAHLMQHHQATPGMAPMPAPQADMGFADFPRGGGRMEQVHPHAMQRVALVDPRDDDDEDEERVAQEPPEPKYILYIFTQSKRSPDIVAICMGLQDELRRHPELQGLVHVEDLSRYPPDMLRSPDWAWLQYVPCLVETASGRMAVGSEVAETLFAPNPRVGLSGAARGFHPAAGLRPNPY